MRSTHRASALILGVVVALSGMACSSTDPDDGGDPDDIDPVVTEDYLQRNFSKIPRITEALVRILATVNGQPQTGVTFTPITGGVQGTVGVDLDNNGSMETTVSARVNFNNSQNLNAGGVLTITAINAGSTTGTASANITVQGTSTVAFTAGQATLFPTEGPSQIDVSNASITATASLSNPVLLGSADFGAGSTSGTVFFESNGAGGFRIRVTSPDFNSFTVP